MAKNKEKNKEKSKKEKKGKKKGKSIEKISVNFWRTKIHGTTMGMKVDLSYEAKSRQFSKNFDIVGKVTFNGDEDGEKFTTQVVAVDTKKWDDTKRLLIRTFTELKDNSGGNYKGGIELSILESINTSHVAQKSLPVFIASIAGFELLTRMTKMRTVKGNHFFFPILPETGDSEKIVHFIRISGKVGMGDDFNVFDGEEKIAVIDDRKMDIGGKYDIKILSEEYQKNKRFTQLIILFSAVLKFMNDCEKDINELLDKIQDEKKFADFKYIPDPSELQLFKNPRRLK
ncbi:MAG: hypothetical protein GY870_07710 [archaeon]|nr:hypothetical protein [archaeon]